jgi:hypothetical protein
MSSKKSPLHDLVSEGADALNLERLMELLKPFVRFDKQTGGLGFFPAFAKLGPKQKVLVILAASKARHLLSKDFAWQEYPDGLYPKEVLGLRVMPDGSAKPAIKGLFDSHRIRKDADDRYYFPDFLIDELATELSAKFSS